MKIYIISGKARSGKDFVADLIEDYYKDLKVMKLHYSYYLKDYLKRMNLYDENNKPRTLMQEFGNYLRCIDPLFLINRLKQDILVFSKYYDIIIICDARIKEEIDEIKKIYPDCKTIRVNRNIENNLTEKEKKDITEVGLDDYSLFDLVIENDDDIKYSIRRYLDE